MLIQLNMKNIKICDLSEQIRQYRQESQQQHNEMTNQLQQQHHEVIDQLTEQHREITQQLDDTKEELMETGNKLAIISQDIHSFIPNIAPKPDETNAQTEYVLFKLFRNQEHMNQFNETGNDNCMFRCLRTQKKSINKLTRKTTDKYPSAIAIKQWEISAPVSLNRKIKHKLKQQNELIKHSKEKCTFGTRTLNEEQLIELINQIIHRLAQVEDRNYNEDNEDDDNENEN